MSALLSVRNPDSVFGDEFERIESMAQALAAAVDHKARYRPSHSQAVAKLAMTIGALMGINGRELARLRLAGLLHDIGKLQIPDSILLKPDALTPSEFAVIERHPVHGHDQLIALGLTDEARWVLHHHERGDGTGYPTGLVGTAIPFASRILAVADAFDCMVTRRTYKEPYSIGQALAELDAGAGTQFDRDVVRVTIDLLDTPR